MSAPRPPLPAEDYAAPLPSPALHHSEDVRRSIDSFTSQREPVNVTSGSKVPVRKLARHTLGIILLLVTVVLWTASNFLASTIFADDTYSKPYFVTYVNSSFFSVFLVFVAARRLWASGGSIRGAIRGHDRSTLYSPIEDSESQPFVKPDEERPGSDGRSPSIQLQVDDSMTGSDLSEVKPGGRLNIRETAWLSFEFCLLWFLANYFVAACLEYTTVASSTILTSTSSIWTLIIGGLLHVEPFTLRKLLGTLASFAGIILISTVDFTGNNDKNRGSFPHKSHAQLAIGDALAFASALLYGIYTTLMKKRIGDEARVDMSLFFGFVGLFNLVTLLPGFFILHWLDIEPFELPPTRRITTIVLVNSATSLISDFCWAYSMLLTSPLLVTVGLSLTIPVSLFGQMILNGQTSSVVYWLGAGVVFCSFVFINYESKGEGNGKAGEDGGEGDGSTENRGGFGRWWRRVWERVSQSRQ